MATSDVKVDEGTAVNLATYSISEDAVTKEIGRAVLNTSAGAEIPVGGGTEATALRVTIASDSTGVVSVDDNGAALTVDGTVTLGAGTAEIGKLAAGTAAIGKLAANDGVDIGNVDVASIAAGTNVIGGILPNKYPTTDDAVFMRKYYTNAGAVTDGIVWSPAAGTRWYVTDLIINVSAACVVTLEDDKAAGDDPVMKFEFAANGGMVSNFKTPFASGEDAADLLVTTTAGNIYITAVGYEL